MIGWIKSLFFQKKEKKQWIAEVSIAGLQHYRGDDLAELIKEGDPLKLLRQPDNTHDENAIIVMWHNNKIGYIPRALAKDIGRQIDSGVTITANIAELKPVKFGRKWIKIRIQSGP